MPVQEFEVKKILISKIKFDDSNPNVVSDEQMNALKKGMEKYGYLAPIILNKNLEVVDGEHRVRIYQHLKKKTIPCYIIDVEKIDAKMLRQVLNKLRGEHEPLKDASEFVEIFNSKREDEFAALLAQPKDDFIQAMSEYGLIDFKPKDAIEDEVNIELDAYKITFNFKTEDEYEQVLGRLKEINETKEDALLLLVNKHEN